jgi:uridine kinase
MDNKKNLLSWILGTLVLLGIAIYPNIVYAIINDGGISYVITSIIFACPLVGIVAILPRKWMYCVATILLTIMSIIDLSMVDLYKDYLLPGGILSTIRTNPQEATEFYNTNLKEVFRWIPLVTCCVVGCCVYQTRSKLISNIVVVLGTLIISTIFVCGKVMGSYDSKITFRYYIDHRIWNRTPYNVVFQSINTIKELNKRKYIEHTSQISFGAQQKTTTSKKLALELMANGYKSKIISLDCYYLGRDKTPRDKNGELDFECLEALNIDLLNQNLIDLFDGKEVIIPSYDFKVGMPFFEESNKMSLEENEFLILEGIHGLNDKLTPKIPNELKFKLYISALTQLNLNDSNRISTKDNRLIRRIVRDAGFRGKSASGTIKMWPSVLRGEELHIYPFHNNADAILNTALDYELSVLRVYAEPILRCVPPTQKEYSEAQRLLKFLENFSTIPPTAIPPRSILREFIGGSAFKY